MRHVQYVVKIDDTKDYFKCGFTTTEILYLPADSQQTHPWKDFMQESAMV